MTPLQWVGVAMLTLPILGFVIHTLRGGWKFAAIFWTVMALGFAWFLVASILVTGAR